MTTSTVEKPELKAGTGRLFGTLAITGLVSTIALIMVGSIVRVTGNGLGCPDWPLCYGQAIPPFLGSAWVEFAHRLFGGFVVLQVGALVALAWRDHRDEPWIFRPAVAMVFVLTLQVVLGGIHVLYELPRWTGWIHTGVAMLVAGLLAFWVAMTQPAVIKIGQRTAPNYKATRLPGLTVAGAALSYLLILTGSLVTRTGASLVCPAFPHCGLESVPEHLQSIVTVQMIHRITAIGVAFAIVVLLWQLWQKSNRDRGIRSIAWIIIGLFIIQISLGLVNIWFAIPMWSRVLHLGTAASIWSSLVILAVTVQHAHYHYTHSRHPADGTGR